MVQITTKFLKLTTLVLFAAVVIFYAKSNAVNAPTYHLDGAFQTASGLFRLDAGQFPGRDFFPYLGIGPLITLYPAFKIFGSNLAASVISAQTMTLLFSFMCISILLHLIFKPKSFFSSITASSCFFALILLWAFYFPCNWSSEIRFLADPGNSLRPIRSSIPYIAAFVFFLLFRHQADINNGLHKYLKILLFSITIGFVSLWSNDFVIPTVGVFSFLAFLNILNSRNENTIKLMLLFLGGVVLASVTLLTTFTHGHPVEMLKFNFLDVARDQFWYFAPYSESSRIFEFTQLLRLIPGNNLSLLALILCFAIALKSKSLHNILVFCIGLTLFGGGALSSIGGHLESYFVPFYIWGFITILFFTLRLFLRLFLKNFSSRSTNLMLLILSFCFMSTLCFLTHHKHKKTVRLALNDTQRFFVDELSAFLPITWQGYIDYVRASTDKKVIEEYWGIWSAMQKIFPPWPVDSVIHALGSTREVAKSALPEADIIVTTRHSASGWQAWNLRQNFWFYDELFNNWSVREESPTTIVWKKNARSRISTDIISDCRVSNDKRSFKLNIPCAGFYKVQVKFNFSSSKGRHLLLINNNIDEVSIEPRSENAFFPAYFSMSGNNVLSFKILETQITNFLSSHARQAKSTLMILRFFGLLTL